MTVHRMSGTDTLNDLRFICKKMAALLILRKEKGLVRLSRKIERGTCTVVELENWYTMAIEALRKPN